MTNRPKLKGKCDREDARSLAIAYNAFNDAVTAADNLGITVWGPMLKRAMENTGVPLTSTRSLDGLVARAEKEEAARREVVRKRERLLAGFTKALEA